MFWQIIVSDQKPKLMVQMNSVEMEGLVDTGADVSFPKSWNPDWPLQNVYTQFIGNW